MILTRKYYALFTAAFVCFVIYASLVPLKFSPLPWEQGVARFIEMMRAPIHMKWSADWISNILLFMPLGYGMMAAFHTDRDSRAWGLFVVLPFAVFLSAAIEFAQVWFPARHTNPNDVAAEGFGALLGALAWVAFGPRLTERVRDFWTVHGSRNWAVRLLPAYLAVLVALHAAPFDISISPSELKTKYREGKIRPLPFDFHGGDSVKDFIEKTAFNVAFFVPAGVLLGAIRRRDGDPRFSLGVILGLGLLLTAAIEFMQIFILTHYTDTTDILSGTFGVYLGWCLVKLNQYDTSRLTLSLRLTSLVVWSVILIAVHWFPFQFNLHSDWLAARWEDVNWLPFHDDVGTYLDAGNKILRKALLFVPFGMLFDSKRAAAILGFLFAAIIEAGQFFMPLVQHPSVADPLVETVGAVLGALAAIRLQKFTQADHLAWQK